MAEGIPAPESEQIVPSPTEASNRWAVNYSPSLKRALAGSAAFVIGVVGWNQGHIDLGTAQMAMETGLFSEAALKGILGVAEVVAGAAGGIGLGTWAWRNNERQLNANPKPQ